jgi:hypothetical protein
LVARLRQYRQERCIRAGLTGEIYERAPLKLAQSSFMQPQSMVEDRYFYDPVSLTCCATCRVGSRR